MIFKSSSIIPISVMYKTVDTIVSRTVASIGDRLVELNVHLAEEQSLRAKDSIPIVYLKQLLVDIGFKLNKGVEHPKGFVASYGNGRPHVAFMCYFSSSMPAESTVNRNLVAICAIGAGTAVREVLRLLKWRGKISLVVIPLSESCDSKKNFNLSRFFDNVDACCMADPSGGTRNILRISVNASISLTIKFMTNNKNVSVTNSIDARSVMDAAAYVYSKMSAIRFKDRSNCFINGVITKGGSKMNLQPKETELYFCLKAPNTAKLQSLEEHLLTVIKEAELGCNCFAQVIVDAENNEIRNSKVLSRVYSDIAATKGVFFETETLCRSEYDVCAIPYAVPTVVASYQLHCSNHHDGESDSTDACSSVDQSIKQMEIMALTAIQVFTDRELRLTMAKEMECQRQPGKSQGDRRRSSKMDDFSFDPWIFPNVSER